jgi:hypothetical protein
MTGPPKELLEFLEPYSRGIQELTFALRQLVLEEIAPCCEYILEVYTVALLYGSTHSVKDGICYIGVSRNHVNLSFYRGIDLADPNKFLEGTGKRTRHVKIRNTSDLERPAIRSYLRDACELAGHDVSSEKPREVSTVVKGRNTTKRSIGTTRF